MTRWARRLFALGRLLILTGGGLCVPCVVLLCRPAVYEARGEFWLEIRWSKRAPHVDGADIDFSSEGNSYGEIYSTRLSCWRSDKVLMRALRQYRANEPASTTTDKEILDTLACSEIVYPLRLRRARISVRSTSPKLAAALANAYVAAIESFTDEENKVRCEKAVQLVSDHVARQLRTDEDISKRLQKFRAENNVAEMTAQCTRLEQTVQQLTSEVRALRSKVESEREWEWKLMSAQVSPAGSFLTKAYLVPRSSEIGTAYNTMEKLANEMNQLRAKFYANYPAVKAKEKELESAKTSFAEAVSKALATTRVNLNENKERLEAISKRREQSLGELMSVSNRIICAQAGFTQLEKEKEVSAAMLKRLVECQAETLRTAEQNCEVVRLGPPAVATKLPPPGYLFVLLAMGSVALVSGVSSTCFGLVLRRPTAASSV